jgi:type 1 glutamine amidotransferase
VNGRPGLAIALLLGCCGGEPERITPDPPTTGRPRILVVTHTTGYRHSSIGVAEQTLEELAAESGAFEVAFARNESDVRERLTPGALEGFAGVVFANTSGDLGIPDLSAFLGWIADGHAFVGVHGASDTYHGAPDYLAMLGAEFKTHGAQCEVDAKVEDASHAAVAHLAPTYRVFDEIYELTDDPRPRAQILLSVDHHPPDGHPEAGSPGDFPLSWVKSHGRGRVFYTALGHREEIWQDARFRQHLLGAIRWSLASN